MGRLPPASLGSTAAKRRMPGRGAPHLGGGDRHGDGGVDGLAPASPTRPAGRGVRGRRGFGDGGGAVLGSSRLTSLGRSSGGRLSSGLAASGTAAPCADRVVGSGSGSGPARGSRRVADRRRSRAGTPRNWPCPPRIAPPARGRPRRAGWASPSARPARGRPASRRWGRQDPARLGRGDHGRPDGRRPVLDRGLRDPPRPSAAARRGPAGEDPLAETPHLLLELPARAAGARLATGLHEAGQGQHDQAPRPRRPGASRRRRPARGTSGPEPS